MGTAAQFSVEGCIIKGRNFKISTQAKPFNL